jgi:hypothetical protein
MGDAGNGGMAMGEINPQALAQLPPEVHAMVTNAVVEALHPIFLLAAAVAGVGLIVSLFLEEIELKNRRLPQSRQEAAAPAE